MNDIMSFDPLLLLVLADNLCADVNYHDESKYRTSISRAYYAAHLTARCKLESSGFIFTEKKNVHQEVIDQLKNSNKKASDMLYKLRRDRNKADYKLDIQIYKGDAISCLKSSKIIIGELTP